MIHGYKNNRKISVTRKHIPSGDLENTVFLVDESDLTAKQLAYYHKGLELGGLSLLRKAKKVIFFTATVTELLTKTVETLFLSEGEKCTTHFLESKA